MPAACMVGCDEVGTGPCTIGVPCCPHAPRGGKIVTGSPNVNINGQPAHRKGDQSAGSCAHGYTSTTVAGSGTVFVNGLPLERLGDPTKCDVSGVGGKLASGSPNVNAG